MSRDWAMTKLKIYSILTIFHVGIIIWAVRTIIWIDQTTHNQWCQETIGFKGGVALQGGTWTLRNKTFEIWEVYTTFWLIPLAIILWILILSMYKQVKGAK